ncbi:proton-coupled zinc antiporter SLC30A2 [Episyrphus balteatus]|uniref:proton-coupled zinc antiporter SLC30A2 n=1 Tax=Episyrphus balteatus TaxID=286459 RepID=UPI002486900F|nr:proton-coupled zinc antiporter SLC30A2 [Episyrphus balteatus]
MSEYYLDNRSFGSDEDLLSLTAAGDRADDAHGTLKSSKATKMMMKMMTNGNNNNNHQHYSIDDDGIGGTEDSTMEIPLLVDNTDGGEIYYNNCKHKQPGFAVNLKSKSQQDAKIKIFLAIALCCLFMIIEFLGGYMAGSLAIMTDAAHLASDCVSFVIGLLAIWISSRTPDQNMSFGYKRIEVIGALVSILGIWILTAFLAIVACQRLFSDDFDLNADTMMIIAGIGILINIAMAFILHGSSLFPGSHGHSHGGAGGGHHSHSHVHSTARSDAASTTHGHHSHLPDGGVGNPLPADVSVSTSADIVKQQHARNNAMPACGQEQNLNLRAAVIHVFGDLVQSVGVFVASIIIKFYPNAKLADPLCTLLFSVIVIFTTVNLFKESVCILLDSVPKLVPLLKLQSDLSSISGVKSVHHLNVWNHTVNHSIMMVHLVVDILADSDAILTEATSMAHDKYHIQHSTIQIERV